ncbi:MAG: flagellar basal body P-ring formation chaperone FlgA, partial [Hyphomicrobiales bacterium]
MLNSQQKGAQLMKAPHFGPQRARTLDEKRHFAVAAAVRTVKTPTLWALLLAFAVAGAALAGEKKPGDWQSLESIRNTAETFVRDQLSRKGKLLITAGSLDARLRLPQCAQALVAFLPNGYSVGSNTAVGVRCRGPKTWKLFVPVRVAVLSNVLTASRPLARGAEITSGDLSFAEKDVTNVTGTYFTEPDQVEDMRLKRGIRAGEIMVSSMLEASHLVHRGQTVTLVARNSAVQISATGKALSDGAINQRIKV